MTDDTNFSKEIEQKEIKDFDETLDSALSAIAPKDIQGITKLMDTAFTAIAPKDLEVVKNLMTGNISSVIDPKVFLGINQSMANIVFSAIDPKDLESINSLMRANTISAVARELQEDIGRMQVVDFPKQSISDFAIQIPRVEAQISESYTRSNFEEQQDYHEKSLKLLEEIRENTGNLSTIIDLIADSNEKQEIILQFIEQMLEIATAKNQDELNNKFQRVLENIKNSLELGELTGKLLFYAYTIFSLVSPHIGR